MVYGQDVDGEQFLRRIFDVTVRQDPPGLPAGVIVSAGSPPGFEVGEAYCLGEGGETIVHFPRGPIIVPPVSVYDPDPSYRTAALVERAVALCLSALGNVGFQSVPLADVEHTFVQRLGCEPFMLWNSATQPNFQPRTWFPPSLDMSFDVAEVSDIPRPVKKNGEFVWEPGCLGGLIIGIRKPVGVLLETPQGIGMLVVPKNVAAIRVPTQSKAN